MEKRFELLELHICTFSLQSSNIVKANLEEYPRRLCIVDNQRKIVVDIEHKLQYDYIETMSGLYLINKSIEKIKENKRAAILPCYVYLNNLDENTLSQAKQIIKTLEIGSQYPDGNTVLSNEEYLYKIKKDTQKEEKTKVKTKKIGKK